MPIRLGSRYELSVVDFISFEPDEDAYPVVFYEFDELSILTYQEYPYKQGERLDNIAMKFYGKPGFWWIIMEANPEIEDIQNIPPGTFLRIPRV
jgi:phage tail protein X